MDSDSVIRNLNSFLNDSAMALANWLNGILPRITADWWDECVLPSLSYEQQEIAENNNYSKLSDFDLASLLRITNKSWYEINTVRYLSSEERETINQMTDICTSWTDSSAPPKDKEHLLQDLRIIETFMQQLGYNQSDRNKITSYIFDIEQSYHDSYTPYQHSHNDNISSPIPKENSGVIPEKTIVYLISNPKTQGVILSAKKIDNVVQYSVFLNGSIQNFLGDQIAPVCSEEYHWSSVSEFRSYLTAYQINNPSSQNLYSLNSARIDFVPYQFRPALKLLHSDEPRILIADSVGVGKTIEAGLIIKELEARSELERIVVICPKPLVAERKWELEMKRFDEEFIPLDGPTFRGIISDTDRDGEWPSRYNKVIIPYSILDSRAYQGHNKRGMKSYGLKELDPEPHFDLVIVDEAHHIRNGSSDKDKAFAYKCTKYFCDHAEAVIMLTATPLQTSDNDLFTLLNVLRPDVIIDKNTFDQMSHPNAYISRAIHLLRSSEEGWNTKASLELQNLKETRWGKSVIAVTPLYRNILRRLENNKIERDERIRLISDIESLHSFNTIINRTRRRDIQDFCVRRSHTISTMFTEYQQTLHDELLEFERNVLSLLHGTMSVSFMMTTIRRQAASCLFGLAPHIRDIVSKRMQQMYEYPELDLDSIQISDNIADTLNSCAQKLLSLADNLPKEDPKFEKILELIGPKQEQTNNKIMVFSTFRYTLEYLNNRLSDLGYRVAQIDGSVKDEERYRLKSRFELSRESQQAIDILLFSEVGSEGLDYQSCDMMINYDLPWNPMRIEQRIGRIDRRGQKSEVVNIYNIITEDTVDADIYYRCLSRIGVFEASIGDCEEILGRIATSIEDIASDSTLTDAERQSKLEQIADNEVRKVQELNRLEEAEKELFSFNLSEFTTSQEIRQAENPWLSGNCLKCLIEHYINERVGKGTYILGESLMKTLRLSQSARDILRNDFKQLPHHRNPLRQAWDNYLRGTKPNHAITFDADAASKDRSSFFITAMHPLAKQAANFFRHNTPLYVQLHHKSSIIPPGEYTFQVYAWQYLGINTSTKLTSVCNNSQISKEIPFILEDASKTSQPPAGTFDWSHLEALHLQMLQEARTKHKEEVQLTATFRKESLENTYHNKVRTLEQQIDTLVDESIRRMHVKDLDNTRERFERKKASLKDVVARADIHYTLLVNGVITIEEK